MIMSHTARRIWFPTRFQVYLLIIHLFIWVCVCVFISSMEAEGWVNAFKLICATILQCGFDPVRLLLQPTVKRVVHMCTWMWILCCFIFRAHEIWLNMEWFSFLSSECASFLFFIFAKCFALHFQMLILSMRTNVVFCCCCLVFLNFNRFDCE